MDDFGDTPAWAIGVLGDSIRSGNIGDTPFLACPLIGEITIANDIHDEDDADALSVSLTVGQTVTATMFNANAWDSLADGLLTVVDQDGIVLTSDTFDGLNGSADISFTAHRPTPTSSPSTARRPSRYHRCLMTFSLTSPRTPWPLISR